MFRIPHLRVACLALTSLLLCAFPLPLRANEPSAGGAALSGGAVVAFNRDIRPILSDNCFACHGPDANKREADLRLDTAEGLVGDGTHGAVVPGNASASELFARINSTDPSLKMPPPEYGKELTPEQIDLLQAWIDAGAEWQGHWSFQPVERPDLPSLTESPASMSVIEANPIDRFLLATLQERGLVYSPAADARTQIRRLYFDLLGLPPTPEAVEQFVAEAAESAAYERLVDELLASPHFGERMAIWWLDLVRYADSVGYHGDQPVSVSPYRDYVIRSFNQNKPFDQFTIEQLAGDLLPQASLEQQVAAGYNRLGMMSAEGGVQPKEYLAKYIAERVRNLGGTWLGVTLGCCECHDHKYDPFTAADFYGFEAFFADIQEQGLYGGDHWGPDIRVPTQEQNEQLARIDDQLASVRRRIDEPSEALSNSQRAWEAAHRPWQVLKPASFESTEGAGLTLLDDNSLLASGPSPATDITQVWFDMFPAEMTAIRIEVLPDPSLPQQGPGRAGNGNFVLSELEVFVEQDGVRQVVPLHHASATYEQTGAAEPHPDKKWTAASAIDGDARGATWGWAIMEQVGRPQSAVFEVQTVGLNAKAVPAAEAASEQPATQPRLLVVLKQQLDNPQHTLGRFRIWASVARPPVRAEQLLPPAIESILALRPEARTPEQVAAVAAHYRASAPELEPVRQQLQQLEADRKRIEESIPTMLVTKTVEPRMVRILARGNWMDDSGHEVVPAIPALLGGKASDRRLNRLDLAEWVVSQNNPLTARVTMNRLWKLLFGVGLSSKLDDLGAQGEWPSHPELLDWLAAEFHASGWNIKHMMKLIVMSQAYRQTSSTAAELAEVDPFNRLVARQGRWRLDAEVVRDTLLATSGLLIDELGGTSVNPYQPAGYWAYLNFPQREWQNGQGSDLYRRGVYTHWQRQYLHPALLAFDAPSREECTADRPRSNTPLQALVLLNDPSYVEAARAFAAKILTHPADSDERRLEWAIRDALARSPRQGELSVLAHLLETEREAYSLAPADARAFLHVGEVTLAPEVEPAEWAAWTHVARAILNTHELITRN
jgi:mono/diheme cytochrome c family protein